MNDVVGVGVYLLPAAAATLLGAASVWAVLLAGFAVALIVLCFAEASSYFDQPGGAYLYTREAFGSFIGFEIGWMSWVTRVSAIASLSIGLAQAMTYFWPAAALGLPRAGITSGVIVALAWINMRGVRAGARTGVALVIAKMLPLVFFIVAGAWFVDPARLQPLELPRLGNLGEAALLLLFAYSGFENTPVAAGEYRNPRRDVPFALIITIVMATVLYTAVQVVALGTFPGLAGSPSPLAQAAVRFAGHWGGGLLTAGALFSIAGSTNNSTLFGPRYVYAMAADGYGPRWIGRVHPGYHTPAAAIIVQTLIALALALSGSFVQLAMLSTITRLITYLGTAAAVPVLRRRLPDRSGALHLPLGSTIPIATLLLALGLMASAKRSNLLLTAGALAIGAVIYKFRRPSSGERSTNRAEDRTQPPHSAN